MANQLVGNLESRPDTETFTAAANGTIVSPNGVAKSFGLSVKGTGALNLMQMQTGGIPGYSAGTFTVTGLIFNPSMTVPAGVNISTFIASDLSPAFGATGGGKVHSWTGQRANLNGPLSPGANIDEIVGFKSIVSNRVSTPRLMAGFQATKHPSLSVFSGTVIDAVAFDVDSQFANSASMATWSGIRIQEVTGPPTRWGINHIGSQNNRFGTGKNVFGSTQTVPGILMELISSTTDLLRLSTSPLDTANYMVMFDSNTHHYFGGDVPTIGGNCGTTPAISGNDTVGTITVGTGANGGSCAVTFVRPWNTAPHCFCENETTANLARAINESTGTFNCVL